MTKPRIIIVGGGFAGVKCAATLSRELTADKAEILLFNDENHLVFSPLLAEVVGSSINPIDVIVPLRQLLPGVFCRTETVQNIAQDGRRCRCAPLPYHGANGKGGSLRRPGSSALVSKLHRSGRRVQWRGGRR